MSVFKFSKKSHLERTCFFDDPVDIGRFDKVKYPQFEKLTKQQISYFWVPEEVDLSKDNKDYKQLLSPQEQHFFTANIKRQTLLDSVQGRAPSLAFLPIVSLPELETWIQTWAFFETGIHSRSYSHILRNIFTDPSIVFDEMSEIQEIVDCGADISKYYDDLISWNNVVGVHGYTNELYNHKKALWLCLNAVNFLEGIRFYASFFVSWNFAEQQKMEGNAKIIKLICRDENLHMASTQQLLKLLPREDPDFIKIQDECKDEVYSMAKAVVDQEHAWAHYLFKDGSMIGLNEKLLCDAVDERGDKCLRNMGLEPQFGNKKNVLPWTSKWIAGGDVQVAPQETQISSYTVGAIKQDLDIDKLKSFTL